MTRVPFDFLKRRSQPDRDAATRRPPSPRSGKGVTFDGLTEEWRLVGVMEIDGRMSDALNRREPLAISDVSWAPIDGSAPFSPVPGLQRVDPYDLIIVLTSANSMPVLTEAEHAAHKVHKVAYDVALDVAPFRVIGTVYLYPGSEPDRLLDRATELFLPVIDAFAFHGERRLDESGEDTVLVNRSYLKGVEQVDRRTMAAPVPLPGRPLGGVSWTDRSR